MEASETKITMKVHIPAVSDLAYAYHETGVRCLPSAKIEAVYGRQAHPQHLGKVSQINMKEQNNVALRDRS
jgi:hypothetical protein